VFINQNQINVDSLNNEEAKLVDTSGTKRRNIWQLKLM